MSNCSNFIVCNNICEYENNVCRECIMLFGKWRGKKEILTKNFSEICNICNTKEMCITRPDCDHYLCIKCFKNIYFHIDTQIIDDSEKLIDYLEYKNSLKKCSKCHT